MHGDKLVGDDRRPVAHGAAARRGAGAGFSSGGFDETDSRTCGLPASPAQTPSLPASVTMLRSRSFNSKRTFANRQVSGARV